MSRDKRRLASVIQRATGVRPSPRQLRKLARAFKQGDGTLALAPDGRSFLVTPIPAGASWEVNPTL